MSTTNDNGHIKVRKYTPKNAPLRFCMNKACQKYCHRSNRFRIWRLNVVTSHTSSLPKFQKAEIVLCPACFNNRQLGKMMTLAGGAEVLPANVVKMIAFNK